MENTNNANNATEAKEKVTFKQRCKEAAAKHPLAAKIAGIVTTGALGFGAGVVGDRIYLMKKVKKMQTSEAPMVEAPTEAYTSIGNDGVPNTLE